MGEELRAAKALADDHFRNAQRLSERLIATEEALRWIRDHCRKLRLGTDDWFGDYAHCDTKGRNTPRRLSTRSRPSLKPSASSGKQLVA